MILRTNFYFTLNTPHSRKWFTTANAKVCACAVVSKPFKKSRCCGVVIFLCFSLFCRSLMATEHPFHSKKVGRALQVQVHCFNLTYNSNYGGNKLTMVHFRIIMRKSLYVEHKKKRIVGKELSRAHIKIEERQQWAFNFNWNARSLLIVL